MEQRLVNVLKALLACSISVIATFQGCPKFNFDFDFRFEIFVSPLVPPSKCVAPDELIGSFVGRTQPSFDNTTEEDLFEASSESFRTTPFFHVGRAGGKFPKGFLRLVSVDVPQDSSGTITSTSDVFFVKKIGKSYIAHLPIVKGETLGDSEAWDASKCDGYLLAELRLVNNSLEIRVLNRELLDKLIDAKTILLESGDSDVKLVTNTAKSLNEIFTKYGGELFKGDVDTFRQVK